ncbi:transposase-like zinc-binding domain-containing protein, partial [Campylobacter ureolyticus]
MKNKTTELDIILQLFNSLSNDDKKSFIKEIKNKETSNKVSIKKEIKYCPHCKSTKFVKNGKSSNTQRFL